MNATCPADGFASLCVRALTLWLFVPFGYVGCTAQETARTDDQHRYTNALINSTSPYLLQHAHNPVNWLPWGPEAFERAKRENKPIFVSIGYSTCYWCHVMERESFENEQVAAVLNEHFIAVKVDREQRPDIDEQLMLATQLMNGRGGWPNSVWLTTDGRPWMTGTYFPREQFISALEQLVKFWKDKPDLVDKQAQSLADAIREASKIALPKESVTPDASPLTGAMAELNQIFDARHGGFGKRPKFPPHGALRLLALAARESESERALKMLSRTLDGIWYGGMHDHIGGGFHRYSTDERWLLPHFEKMLYDNAQLMRSFTEAHELTGGKEYRAAVEDIFVWLSREMTHQAGGFYSAIDSESDGEEGRFYTWTVSELSEVLNSNDAKLFAKTYNFSPEGNFTEEATGRRTGTNIPHRTLPDLEPSARSLPDDEDLSRQLATIRDGLLQQRANREYPHLDDKVLTSWNGLMISSLAYAGHALAEPRYVQAATKAANFILTELKEDGKLLRTWRDGQASLPGYLNDYAFFAEALVELHTATNDARWLTEAENVVDEMLEQFEDRSGGGFFFTGELHEDLIVRSKNLLGGGNLPVGNGVAAQVLLQMYEKTGRTKYLDAAKRTLSALSGVMHGAPRQVEHLVLANSQYLALQAEDAPQQRRPDARHEGQAVVASLYVSRDQLIPGQECTLAVALDVADRFHLYGPVEKGGLVMETTLKLSPNETFQAGELKRPQGIEEFDDIVGRQITKYEGLVWFYLPFRVSDEAEIGKTQLQVDLRYQACDSRQCLRPQTVPLAVQLNISPDQSGPPRHASIFESK